jgi:porphyrinogen peroxidase
MADIQAGILAPIPRHARYLSFQQTSGADPTTALRWLAAHADGEQIVVGLGQSLVQFLGRPVEGLRTLPAVSGAGLEVPSTPVALWCWLRGDERGVLLHRARSIEHSLASAFVPSQTLDAFRHDGGRDLTGYEDGTENPKGEAAFEATFARGRGQGLDGSSFVAVQQWQHDLDTFEAFPAAEQDNMIGRRKTDNEELEDAPESSHVKRTAQESFEPEAFNLRRSMPWADGNRAGLNFVAFGKSFDAFEAQLNRMVGAEDGITDALFRFSRPITGSYFWCPPMAGGQLDLSALGIEATFASAVRADGKA